MKREPKPLPPRPSAVELEITALKAMRKTHERAVEVAMQRHLAARARAAQEQRVVAELTARINLLRGQRDGD